MIKLLTQAIEHTFCFNKLKTKNIAFFSKISGLRVGSSEKSKKHALRNVCSSLDM